MNFSSSELLIKLMAQLSLYEYVYGVVGIFLVGFYGNVLFWGFSAYIVDFLHLSLERYQYRWYFVPVCPAGCVILIVTFHY